MKTYWESFRQFNRETLLFLGYWGAIAFGYFGVVSVLLNLYLLRLGYGPEFIGLMVGAGQLVWAAFALPAGAIGSRFGAKQAMTAGLVVNAVATFLMLAAESLPLALREAGLLLAWMISWMGASLSAVNSAPYLMAVTDDKSRGFAFSAQQTMMAVAGLAGALAAGLVPGAAAGWLGLTLEHPAPYRLALLMAPLAYLAGGLAFTRAKPAALIAQTGAATPAQRAPVGLFVFLGLVIGLQAFSDGTIRAFFNVYLDTVLQASTGLIGGIMGASQVVLIAISLTMPAVLNRWGTSGSLTLSTFVLSLFGLLLAGASSGVVAVAAYLGMIGVATIASTARGIYSQEVVSPRWRMASSAVSTVGLALGWGLSAWLGGLLVEGIGFQGVFLLGALLALLSAGMLVLRARVETARREECGNVPWRECAEA